MSLEQFDEVFSPTTSNRPDGLDTLPDGDYTLTVVKANLKTVTYQNDEVAVLEVQYRTSTGQVVEVSTWLRDARACNILGSELALLGFPTQTWTAANGLPFSKALPDAVRRLPGMIILATKVTSDYKGRNYHNLRVRSLAQSTPPMPTRQAQMNLASEQLPF